MTKTNVLIIEDELWLADQQRMLLEKQGYDVTVSPHIHDAILKIDDNRPDVIILDVLLPGGTGFGLLHELQSYDDTGSIPVVLCTTSASDLPAEQLADYGVRRVLDKSTMHPDDIIAAIKGVL